MTFVTRRRACAVLPSLSLLIACSAGVPAEPDDTSVGATGGSTSMSGGTTGMGSGGTAQGGSAASGGSVATGGSSGASAAGGASGSAAMGGTDAATGGASASGGSSATGGATATGGASPTGGTGGDMGTGGSAGSAATGGSSAGGSAGMSGAGGTDPGICQQLSVVPTPQVPTVELLVDTSSSMFETTPTSWSVLYTALMDPDHGPIKALQSKIRFGFASYEGLQAMTETDPACANMTTVPPGEMNYDAIDAVYSQLGNYDVQHPTPKKWETPTDYAIYYAANTLTTYMPDPPGKKYILLVTDGNPNTCATVDPQCGQDYAIKAAQDAFAQGIGLFVLGVGDIVTDPNSGCQGTGARCGLDHLQDLANAGVGSPVQSAPGCADPTSTSCQQRYSSCQADGTLHATYMDGAADVGVPYAVDTTASDAQTKLTTALSELLSDAISCSIDMDAIVTGDPSLGDVEVNGMKVAYDDPNGWTLDANAYTVELQGTACTTFRSAAAGGVQISFPCDPSGNPIAVHR